MNDGGLTYGAYIQGAIVRAMTESWVRPTVLLLLPGCPVAEAITRELAGSLTPVNCEDVVTAQATCLPVERACELLRAHAGNAGAQVARHLADPAAPAQMWVLALCHDELVATAYFLGKETWFVRHPYGDTPRPPATPSEVRNDQGPTRIEFCTPEGEVGHVYGRTGADTARAYQLLTAIVTDTITGTFEDEVVAIPIKNDDLLARYVLFHFDTPGGAHQVAECVRALKRLPGDRAKQLLRVLRNRPSLSALYARVKQELTGETA